MISAFGIGKGQPGCKIAHLWCMLPVNVCEEANASLLLIPVWVRMMWWHCMLDPRPVDDAAWLLQIDAEVVECAVVIELKDLNGKAKLGGLPLYVQVQKEGD